MAWRPGRCLEQYNELAREHNQLVAANDQPATYRKKVPQNKKREYFHWLVEEDIWNEGAGQAELPEIGARIAPLPSRLRASLDAAPLEGPE